MTHNLPDTTNPTNHRRPTDLVRSILAGRDRNRLQSHGVLSPQPWDHDDVADAMVASSVLDLLLPTISVGDTDPNPIVDYAQSSSAMRIAARMLRAWRTSNRPDCLLVYRADETVGILDSYLDLQHEVMYGHAVIVIRAMPPRHPALPSDHPPQASTDHDPVTTR